MPRPRKNPQASSASSGPSLSPGQASYVIDRLISERRLSQGDLNRYVADLGREINDLESRLQRLREAHGGKIAAAGAAVVGAAAGAVVARRGRKPGRPGRPPGRPAGTGAAAGAAGAKRRPGRPPRAAAATGTAGAEGAATTAPAKGGAKRGRRPAALSAGQLASRQLQGRYLALVRQFPENRRAQFAKTAKEKGRESAIKEMQDALKK